MALGEELWIIIKARNEAAGVMKEAEVSTGSLGSALGGVLKAGAIAAGVAAVAAGVSIFEMAQKATDAALEVRKLSRETGLSAEQASELRYAGERLNVNTDQLSRSFGFFSKNLEMHQDKMQELGVQTVLDAKGNVDFTATMAAMADRFKDMDDGTQKTALAMTFFGKSGKDMIPILNLGSQGLKDMGAEAVATGLVFSQQGVDSAFRYSQAQKDLEDQFKKLTMEVGQEAIPILTTLFHFLSDAAKVILPAVKEGFHGILIGAQILGELFGVITGQAPDAGAKLTDAVGPERAKGIMSALGGIRDAFKTLLAGDIPGFIGDVRGAIMGWITQLGGTNAEDIGKAIGAWTVQFVHWLVDSAVPWLIANLPTIVGTLLHFFLVDVPNALANVLINLGKGIVEGLWSGIESLGGWLGDKIGTFINDHIPGVVKNLLGIASPSTVMAALGLQVTQGLAQGVESGSGLLGSAAAALVATLKSTLQAQAATLVSAAQSFASTSPFGGLAAVQAQAAGNVFATSWNNGTPTGVVDMTKIDWAKAGALPTAPPGIQSFGDGGIVERTGLIFAHKDERVSRPSSSGGDGGGLHFHFEGPVFGQQDLEQMILRAVSSGVLRGAFRGIIAPVTG